MPHWSVQDLTAATGIFPDTGSTSPFTSWVVGNVEHLACSDNNLHLHVLWQSPQQAWGHYDISQQTNMTLPNAVTSWVVGNVEHLAGIDEIGHLFIFWFSPQQGWRSDDLTNRTDVSLYRLGTVTSWVVGNVEHLAGVSGNGHLYLFWWSPGHDWQVDDLTERTGTEHLAGVDANGHLHIFWFTPEKGWQTDDVTNHTGVTLFLRFFLGDESEEGYVVAPGLTSWVVGNVEHMAGISDTGELIVFWWGPGQQNWAATSVSQKTGVFHLGTPTSWSYNAEHLGALDANGHLHDFWYSAGQDWQHFDVSAATGVTNLSSPPTSWVVNNVENLACMDASGHLQLFWWSPST